MARRADDTDGVFTAEEAKKVEEIEKSPIVAKIWTKSAIIYTT